jgi:hypothetical protein
MTGFGVVRPLPGIWDSLHVDTAVTLPLGVEAYAAFALRAWLTSGASVSDRTRRFARHSAVGSLAERDRAAASRAGQYAPLRASTATGRRRAPGGQRSFP